MLAHAAGEDQHVEAAGARRHRPDLAHQPVDVDVEGELRVRVARPPARPARRGGRRAPGQALEPGLVLEDPARGSSTSTPPCCSSQSRMPGSSEPGAGLHDQARPAGVKPIVVSTERPSRTAHSEAPAPRWQETIRRRRPATGRRARPPVVRRRRARGRGSRSDAARSGGSTPGAGRTSRPRPAMVAWNDVSNAATAGTSGSSSPQRPDRGDRPRVVQRRQVGDRVEVVDHLVVDPHRRAVARDRRAPPGARRRRRRARSSRKSRSGSRSPAPSQRSTVRRCVDAVAVERRSA